MKIGQSQIAIVSLGGLEFEVSAREIVDIPKLPDDGGITIGVYAQDGSERAQVLRFDCFRRGPHYHMPPSAPGQLELDAAQVGDGLEWTYGCIRSELPAMIEQAGFVEVAKRVDAAALREGWTRVRDAAQRCAGQPLDFKEYDPAVMAQAQAAPALR
jgi:hypothetical protein